MAKLQMKRIRLLALRKDRKPLMEKLQRLGAVEIEAEEQPRTALTGWIWTRRPRALSAPRRPPGRRWTI